MRKLLFRIFLILLVIAVLAGIWLWRGGVGTVVDRFANIQPVADAKWTEKVALPGDVTVEAPFKLHPKELDGPPNRIIVDQRQFMGFGNMMLAAASAITWSPGTGPTEDQLVDLTVDLLRKKAELSDLNVKKTPTGILGQRALETEITGHR